MRPSSSEQHKICFSRFLVYFSSSLIIFLLSIVIFSIIFKLHLPTFYIYLLLSIFLYRKLPKQIKTRLLDKWYISITHLLAWPFSYSILLIKLRHHLLIKK